MKKLKLYTLLTLIMTCVLAASAYGDDVYMVKDINPTGDSTPYSLTIFGDALYFVASENTTGRELWKSDGTEAGTTMVKDINPGGDSTPYSLTVFDGALYFVAKDGTNGSELWKTDGTAAGTVKVKNIKPASSMYCPTEFNGALYFIADDGTNGMELWKTDGTTAGTVMVKDINPGAGNSSPYWLKEFNGELYFEANDGTNGYELWKTDGTAAGTVMIKDINPGSSGSGPGYMTVFGGVLYFKAKDGTNGVELWKTDGTAAGTVMVKDIQPGTASSYPASLTVSDGTLYFVANDGTSGIELWKTDGTTAGTVMVKDINPGQGSSGPCYMAVFGDSLYFRAGSSNGSELWKTDGTEAGTVMVRDIYPGRDSSGAFYMTEFNSALYFQAQNGTNGMELWKTDSTEAGTIMVKDINPGSGASSPQNLMEFKGSLYFLADDGTNGKELWVLRKSSSPEISLRQGTTDIASGGSYDFGSVAVGSDSGSITFTIENTGTADLSLTGTPKIAISGADTADFSVDETSTTASVAASGNTTFTVTFTPSSIGAKTAVISISNNDSDENPYTVMLNGTGTVMPGYASTPASGSTISIGTAEVGSSISASLQVSETGAAALNITGCTISGTNATDFNISPETLSIADGGAAQDILIQCTPSAAGARTAVLTVNHNAPGSPAIYTLTCTGTATPGYASIPAAGRWIDLGTVEVGSWARATLQVSETGTADLKITSCRISRISGPASPDFIVTPGNLTIANGGAARNISISYNPSVAGTKISTLRLGHNAPGGTATYTLKATGIVTPGYGSSPAPGSTINVGTADIGSVVSSPLKINETGTATLNVTNCIITGANAADFSVSRDHLSIANGDTSGGSIIFIRCTPSAAGTRTAMLTVKHNAPGSPAIYTLNATGTVAPGYESSPAPGSTINVGMAEVGSSVSTNLQISETGTAALNITGCTITGVNAADFSVSPENLTIADGGAARNITIQCTPSAVGTRTATLTIAHNASGSPAIYTLKCVKPGYNSKPASGSLINVGTAPVGTPVSTTLKISETGTAALNITSCTITGANAADFSVSPGSLSIADGGAAQNITIQATPSATGTRTATLTVAHNAPGSPATYTLNCTGTMSVTIFVNAAATGANDGTSWENAYTDLQTALGVAISGKEIWVASGTYKPTAGTDRTISFKMKDGVGIYGGFAGTEAARGQRDREANMTILSGDIGIENNNSDNSYHVINNTSVLYEASVIDGFTITGGNANGDGIYDKYGAGMYSYSGIPTISNCTFSGNNSADNGGGLHNDSGHPTVTNCTFSGNTAYDGGGGMYTHRGHPTVTNCTFSGNTAGFGGGGMENDFESSPIITNCTFYQNTAYRIDSALSYGGGMYNSFDSNPTVTNCTFSENSAANYGGGMENSGSSPTVINCIFSGNTANYGGGVRNSGLSKTTLINCTFAGNTATKYGGAMSNKDSKPKVSNCILWNNLPSSIVSEAGTPTVSYSIVQGGYTGTGNLDVDPLFVDPSSGNYRLQGTSPAINKGSNSAMFSFHITTDLDGNPRTYGTSVDMGAYEFIPPSLLPEISLKQGTTDIASGGSYDFGSIDVGSDSGAVTFTIENTGNVDLNLSGTPKIAISGANAADFSVDETSTTASVAASGNTTFTVTFTPSSAGVKTATISIANNDRDENPYTVTLNGTGTATPDYASSPVSGSTIDVGTAEIGSSASASLQISETGTAALNITGCTITGTNSADFSVSPSTFSIADGGAAQNITIQCAPSAAGARTATLTVAHNAPGSPATYTLTCTGTATPGYASTPVSGGIINIGTAEIGTSASASLQISESGTAALNITGGTITGTNAADFSVSPSSLTIADGGAAQNITIQCTPAATGTRTATLTVTHNAPGSPATYTLNCTATKNTISPEVSLGDVSDITATTALSGGEVIYPENCIATLLASGLVWNTVTPAYPADAHTSAGTEPGSFTGTLTGLLPQTTYYVRAYVQYNLNSVVQILYGNIYELTTTALPGDVNGDKVLDLKDAILALKIVTGAAGNAEINLPADVNGDGKIGMEEAVYVLQNVGTAE